MISIYGITMSKTDIKRKDEFIKLREQGLSYQAIADIYGVSRQCIYQLINRDKVNQSRSSKGYNKKYYQENREKCLALSKKWHEQHPNYDRAYYKAHYVSRRVKKSVDKE